MYQLSSLPALFFRVKAKMAPPCLMAAFLSASLEMAEAMASKASDEGKSAGRARQRSIHHYVMHCWSRFCVC